MASFAKQNKASVLIISLWVLLILTVLAVSVGHRVSMFLKIAQYQRDAVNASFLAKAGVSRAISVLDSDKNGYDAPNDPWVDNETVFKKIAFSDTGDEFASVNYTFDDSGTPKTVFGVRDEESRVNVQVASKNMIKELGADCFSDASQLEKLADYIELWRGRGDPGGPLPTLGEKDKDFKKSELACPEELLVVLEYFFRDSGYQDYRKKSRDFFACIEDKVTIWGDGKISINTVSKPVLTIFLRGLAQDQNEATLVVPLADEIIAKRNSNIQNNPLQAPFKVADDLTTGNAQAQALLDKLKTQTSFSESKYFRIQASGICANIKRNLVTVYNRADKKTVYWHEN